MKESHELSIWFTGGARPLESGSCAGKWRGPTRSDRINGAVYELTVLSPAEGVEPTVRTRLGTIRGERCKFVFHDGTTRPLSDAANRLHWGGKNGFVDSTIANHTSATLILDQRVRGGVIESVGRVEDAGTGNTIYGITIRQMTGTSRSEQVLDVNNSAKVVADSACCYNRLHTVRFLFRVT